MMVMIIHTGIKVYTLEVPNFLPNLEEIRSVYVQMWSTANIKSKTNKQKCVYSSLPGIILGQNKKKEGFIKSAILNRVP